MHIPADAFKDSYVQLAHSDRIISLWLLVFITIAWSRGHFYSSGRQYIIYKLETIEETLYYKTKSLSH